MYNVNQSSGFFVKQNKSKQKAFKISYFYVDCEGVMYYTHNLAYLNFLIKNSNNEHELIDRFHQSQNITIINVQDCRISGVKTFPIIDHIPFHQRSCFELHVTHQHSVKLLIVFCHVEEDIELLHDYLKGGWQKRKSIQDQNHLREDQEQEILEKMQLLNNIQQIFERTKQIPPQIIGKQQSDIAEEITYTGDTENDIPNGTGTLFFKSEGIQFVGEFKEGRKHGSGYIVDSNLDMIYCEFINDELSGI